MLASPRFRASLLGLACLAVAGAAPPPLAAATAGTYNGSVGGRTFSLTVNSSNRITGWSSGGDYSCPGYTITSFSISGASCVIAGDDSFTCGSLGCGSNVNSRISGSFSGNTVTGMLDADFDPPTLSCCSVHNQPFTATRAGGSVPATPSNLIATALDDDRVDLDWSDNSNNETEFRVEVEQASAASSFVESVGADVRTVIAVVDSLVQTAPAFTDIGSVGANSTGAIISGLLPNTTYNFRVRARNANGNSAYSNIATATTLGGPIGPCIPNTTTLCLNNDRFKVQATFNTGSQSGQAQVVELTADTGYLWFFAATNVEAVIKVINACSFNSRYWVFAGGLTDVNVVLTVTDTQTGAVKTYTNPLGTKYQPIQDTSAFATCP